jgi:hypothetical protein
MSIHDAQHKRLYEVVQGTHALFLELFANEFCAQYIQAKSCDIPSKSLSVDAINKRIEEDDLKVGLYDHLRDALHACGVANEQVDQIDQVFFGVIGKARKQAEIIAKAMYRYSEEVGVSEVKVMEFVEGWNREPKIGETRKIKPYITEADKLEDQKFKIATHERLGHISWCAIVAQRKDFLLTDRQIKRMVSGVIPQPERSLWARLTQETPDWQPLRRS